MNSNHRKIVAALILLLAAVLRFSALERPGIWDDESFTLRNLGIIPVPMSIAEGTAPLYFLLLRGWQDLLGDSLWSIRSFSAFWGVAGVAAVGLFAARAISPAAGLFAAGLLSLHPFHLAYSQEARAYALVFALTAGTLWMAWEGRTWPFVFSSSALLWTHPWGAFVWLASVVLIVPLERKALRGAALGRRWPLLLPLLFAAPALWQFSHVSSFQVFWSRPPGLPFSLSVVGAWAAGPFYVGGWRFSSGWVRWLLLAAFAGLWLAALVREGAGQTRRKIVLALTVLIGLPAVAGWVVPQVSGHHRYWLAVLPLTMLLAAQGWDGLARRYRVAISLLCLGCLALSTNHYFTRWQKGNVLQAARLVKAYATARTLLIVPEYLQPLWNYHDSSGLPLIKEAGIDQLAPVIDRHGRAILVTLDVPNPVRDALDARYLVLERTVFPAEFHLGLTVTIYRPKEQG